MTIYLHQYASWLTLHTYPPERHTDALLHTPTQVLFMCCEGYTLPSKMWSNSLWIYGLTILQDYCGGYLWNDVTYNKSKALCKLEIICLYIGLLTLIYFLALPTLVNNTWASPQDQYSALCWGGRALVPLEQSAHLWTSLHGDVHLFTASDQ